MEPRTDWKETIPADEPQRFERFGEQLRALQIRNAKGAPATRTLHNKTTAALEAEFTVLPGLPAHARAGLFGTPATYKAYVRLSNGSARPQPDTKADVRGLAIKVVGVPGKKIIPGMEDARTQDFLLIQSPSTPFRTADEFVTLAANSDKPLLLLPRMIAAFGLFRTLSILRQFTRGIASPVTSVATSRYWSALPIKFGAYAVHYALRPEAPPDPSAKPGTTPNYLREELASRLSRGPLAYDFQVQFYCDATKTPIDDGSVEWMEADAPFITVARLVIKQQQVGAPRNERVQTFLEGLSFDPWHAQEELRPLGNLMRARNPAYRLSGLERGAGAEPDGTEDFGP